MTPRHALLALAFIATPALARDALGVFADWGAFRDPAPPRCYAIAQSTPQRPHDPRGWLAVGTFPRANQRGVVQAHLSRPAAAGAPASLTIGALKVVLVGAGSDAWTADARADAAVVAALRSGTKLYIQARGADGRRVVDSYRLPGAASAIDAAAIGCANR